MSKYTEKVHGKRLLKMLQTRDFLGCCCPSNVKFDYSSPMVKRYSKTPESKICKVCRTFVGIEEDNLLCPCNHYGHDKAIKISWEMLKKKGFCK